MGEVIESRCEKKAEDGIVESVGYGWFSMDDIIRSDATLHTEYLLRTG